MVSERKYVAMTAFQINVNGNGTVNIFDMRNMYVKSGSNNLKMSDKRKTFALPISKPVKSTQVPSSVRKTINTTKKRILPKLNTTLCSKLNPADVTICKADDLQDYEEQYRQIAYGKFMRTMLEECLVREKFEREETEVDVQMCKLADRFNKTRDQLDKTSKRLKEISFVVEQERFVSCFLL